MGISNPRLGPGQTPLSDEETLGLIPGYISIIGELNEWEYENILKGQAWAMSGRRKDILTEKFIKVLHKRMFGDVWDWAGKYRTSNKNLGVPAYTISSELREVLDTIRFWEEQETFDAREIAVRLHHRVVKVHPFANGNGRHSRLLADVFLHNRKRPVFSWGGGANLRWDSDKKQAYLDALHEADNTDYRHLLQFAES